MECLSRAGDCGTAYGDYVTITSGLAVAIESLFQEIS